MTKLHIINIGLVIDSSARVTKIKLPTYYIDRPNYVVNLLVDMIFDFIEF